MYFKLAIFSAVLGAAIIAAALFTIGSILQKRKKPEIVHTDSKIPSDTVSSSANTLHFSQQMGLYFTRWTVFDYAVLALFAFGMLFLLVDVLGVIRDRHDYPYWHYGYLLCGFIFSLLSMLFMLIRLAIVLKMIRPNHLSAINDHHEPNDADGAKNGV